MNAIDKMLANMYVAADNDEFDPGLAIGSQFPPIRAMRAGSEVQGVDAFIHDKGMIFMANRSAEW